MPILRDITQYQNYTPNRTAMLPERVESLDPTSLVIVHLGRRIITPSDG